MVALGLPWGMHAWGQGSPFQIAVERVEMPGMPALQSFAWGQHDGEWLIVGGRTDGLHRRQPFASFDSAGRNEALYVVNMAERRVWSAGLDGLPPSLQAQLASTNLNFAQKEDALYLVGGYGYNPVSGNHETFARLCRIDLPGAIAAVKAQSALSPHLMTIDDPKLAVTGGQMELLGETFVLVGGHNFQGRYNPMGPDHGPGFTQAYNHEILRFQVLNEEGKWRIWHIPSETDSLWLHRRDFNMVPAMFEDGVEGFVAFSGVFQYKADVPWLHCIEVDEGGFRSIPRFQQHYQQYHCPKVPLLSAMHNEMHVVFLGGIGEYYDSLGQHVLDYATPFVRTISRVTRSPDGSYREYRLPATMPAYLGAGAEFIPVEGSLRYPNGPMDLDILPAGRTLLGHVVGGIESSDDNVFWVNEGAHSGASAGVFAVYISQDPDAPADHVNVHANSPLQLQVLPNPYKMLLKLDFLARAGDVAEVTLRNAAGKQVLRHRHTALADGPQHVEPRVKALKAGGTFFLRVQCAGEDLALTLIVEP